MFKRLPSREWNSRSPSGRRLSKVLYFRPNFANLFLEMIFYLLVLLKMLTYSNTKVAPRNVLTGHTKPLSFSFLALTGADMAERKIGPSLRDAERVLIILFPGNVKLIKNLSSDGSYKFERTKRFQFLARIRPVLNQ